MYSIILIKVNIGEAMNLIETNCPKCKKKIFLDMEEIVSESSSRPIKCSQCGNEFIFGFDSDAIPIKSDTNEGTVQREDRVPETVSGEPVPSTVKKTKMVKRVVVKKVKKERPKPIRKVLIIENSTTTREQIGELFEDLISDVIKLKSAEEGIEALKKEKYDLLTVDMVLSSMSGLDFLNNIRRYIDSEKIIIFTGGMGIHTDIFDEGMEGINLVEKGGPDSFETLKEKGIDILKLD